MCPFAVVADEGICGDDEFSHDGGDSDLWWFSGVFQSFVDGLEVRVEASCDQCRHVEGLSQGGASTADMGFAAPGSGLSSDRGEASEACGLPGLERSEFGHLDEQGGGGCVGDARD